MLRNASKQLVVINTQKWQFQYNWFPVGALSATAISQRVMESILQGIEHVSMYIATFLSSARLRLSTYSIWQVLISQEKVHDKKANVHSCCYQV